MSPIGSATQERGGGLDGGVTIDRIQVIYFRTEPPDDLTDLPGPSSRDLAVEAGPDTGDDPTVLLVMEASVGGTSCTAMRTSAVRTSSGRFPRAGRELLERAATAVQLGIQQVPLSKLRQEAGSRIEEALRDPSGGPGRDRRQYPIFSRWRGREARSLHLQPIIDAIGDLSSFASEPRAGPEGDRTTVLLDGQASPPSKAASILDLMDRFEDVASAPPPPKPSLHGRMINDYRDHRELSQLGRNGIKGYLYYYYANGFGLETHRLSRGSFVAWQQDRSMLFSWSASQISSITAHTICVNKEATLSLLASAGLPVPRGRTFTFDDRDGATAFAEQLGFPVVLKPVHGSMGEGVVTDIQDGAGLDEAFDRLGRSKHRGSDVIIEQHLGGADYRIVVVDGEVRGALRREPASVVGDGHRSLLELILDKHFWRSVNPHFVGRGSFLNDPSWLDELRNLGLDPRDIPPEGEVVKVGTSCNISQGADSVDVLDELHPSVADAAVAATAAIPGLRYCGVDVLLEDHASPIHEQAAGIIELNAKAMIGNCEFPVFGSPREVTRHVFEAVAADLGVELPPFSGAPGDTVDVLCRVDGRLRGTRYVYWTRRLANRLGVRATIFRYSSRSAVLRLRGDLQAVSVMGTRMIVGPRRTRPSTVKFRQDFGSWWRETVPRPRAVARRLRAGITRRWPRVGA